MVSKLGFGCMGLTGAYSIEATANREGTLSHKAWFVKLDSTGVKINGTPKYSGSAVKPSLKRLDVDASQGWHQYSNAR
ncbi:hypothetical protein V6N13_014285 [Hibiscus sabdariffa]